MPIARISLYPHSGRLYRDDMRPFALFALALALAGAPALAQTNPVKVATAARFDLFGTGTGPLTNGYMLSGDASVDRQTWLATSDQPSSYTVSFTISHFAWTPAAFRFTPASNGTVSLTLRGPWEQATTNQNSLFGKVDFMVTNALSASFYRALWLK